MLVTGHGLCSWMAWFCWPYVHIIISLVVIGLFIFLFQFTCNTFLFITCIRIHYKITVSILDRINDVIHFVESDNTVFSGWWKPLVVFHFPVILTHFKEFTHSTEFTQYCLASLCPLLTMTIALIPPTFQIIITSPTCTKQIFGQTSKAQKRKHRQLSIF